MSLKSPKCIPFDYEYNWNSQPTHRVIDCLPNSRNVPFKLAHIRNGAENVIKFYGKCSSVFSAVKINKAII